MGTTPNSTARPRTKASPGNGTPSARSEAQQTAAGTLNGPPSGNNHAIPLSARRAEPLDLSTVELRGQIKGDERQEKRQFDMPVAPSYHPTEEEFRDPMEYIKKIAPEAQQYGLCKITPPASFQPPFSINTERFHFRVRRQELNSVEGRNRVNTDYLDQLAKFHAQSGTNLNRFPSVDKRPLDLHRLKKTVEAKGGFEMVCKGKRWAEVGRELGYSGKIMSSLSTSLKNSYQKWLLPFEEWLRLAKPGVHQQWESANGGPVTPGKRSQATTPRANTPAVSEYAPSPVEPPEMALPSIGTSFTAVNTPSGSVSGTVTPAEGTPAKALPSGSLKRQLSDKSLADEGSSRRSKRLRKDAPTVAGSNMHASRMNAARTQPVKPRGDFKPGEACEHCSRADDKLKMVSCGSCDCTYHVHCLEPPLKQKPEQDWNCPKCVIGTNDYGFIEGDVYSLVGFQKKANDFKKHHFSKLESGESPDENQVEKEFWRLVDELSETTEVEYGADIHSTTHGSGFPTVEKKPRDPYSVHPWNLNMLPLDKDSLFRHIKSDISGMTVPWLYVGMVFSTFCWHNEDHFTYSANYQHFGDTKTWYGVPGEDAYKFEEAMRAEVPELFESQPDLLFQLVTLARPEKLRQAGVRVYAIDQHAGDFIITFPRAYHAGFNHGFNFNEAVNFAPADWEPFGEEGVKRLQAYRKQPCFSHDELLMTAASRDLCIKTAKWLAPALERMLVDELSLRRAFLASEADPAVEDSQPYTGPRYHATPQLIAEDGGDDEVSCTFCKAYCYLSRYHCKKTNKMVCLLHAGSYECCDASESDRYSGKDGEHVLYLGKTDDDLTAFVKRVVDKANVPEVWTAKVDKEIEDAARPQLKTLRALLAEGEKIQYDLPRLSELRQYVERCNEWVEEAISYITRKQQRRKSEKGGRKSAAKAAEMEEREAQLRKVDNINRLLEKAELIGFDCPEIHTLRERADGIVQFQKDVHDALNDIRSKTWTDLEELVQRGKEFHVDIPETDDLERVVKRLRWDDSARAMRPNNITRAQNNSLEDVERLLEDGRAMGVPENNPDMAFFREHKAQAELWEAKAKELMAVDQVHFQQLDSLSAQAITLPVSKETLAKVDAILRKQREAQEKILSLINQAKDADFRNRPHYRTLKEVVESFSGMQSKPSGAVELEKLQKQHEDWMREGKKLFGKANAPLHILLQHMKHVDSRNEACFDLSDKPRMPVEPASRQPSPVDDADGVDGSNSSKNVFCICRRPEAGMMIECEICHEWYHGKCLKIARGKVKDDDKYTCPVCDWRVKIPRDAARPKLEELQAWQAKIPSLPFQPDEEATLKSLVDRGAAFRDYLRPFVNPGNPITPEEVGTLRFYLRKIEGADILLAEEGNYLRQALHKWAPVAQAPPPVMMVSQSTRKPRPTKQQKLMARLGVAVPEEIPQEFKHKAHGVRNGRLSEQHGRGQTASAGASASPTASHDPSHPGSASGQGEGRRFLTPLAVQVLGELANAPVVSKVLSLEPHMNSEKLSKMKAILLEDDLNRDISCEEMRRKIAGFTGSVTPTNDYYGNMGRQPEHTAAGASSFRDVFHISTPTTLSQSAMFGPGPYHHVQRSASPPALDPHMFGEPRIFDDSSRDMPVTTAEGASVYDSLHAAGGYPPPPPASGFQSPDGLAEESNNMSSNIDAAFTDLVNDEASAGDSGQYPPLPPLPPLPLRQTLEQTELEDTQPGGVTPPASNLPQNRLKRRSAAEGPAEPNKRRRSEDMLTDEPHANGSSPNGSSSKASHPAPDLSLPFHGHDRAEVTQLVLQCLSDLGWHRAAAQLSRDSGFQLDVPGVAALRNAVYSGEWDKAETLLGCDGAVENGTKAMRLPLRDDTDVDALKLLIRRQHFLELLEKGDKGAALQVLRRDIHPLRSTAADILNELSAYIMCPTPEHLRRQAAWDGVGGQSRTLLLSEISTCISPSVMIPEHRLATLLSTVQRQQILDCHFHCTTETPSLFVDHYCAEDMFPTQVGSTILVDGEVWHLAYSQDGSLMAAGLGDGTVIVFDTTTWSKTAEWRIESKVTPLRGISYLAFSPDNRYIIICSLSNEFVVKEVTTSLDVAHEHLDYPATTAAWLSDSRRFIVGTQATHKPLTLHELPAAGAECQVEVFSDDDDAHAIFEPVASRHIKPIPTIFRMSDLAISPDEKSLVVATLDNRIIVYDLATRRKTNTIDMQTLVTSLSFSPSGHMLLVGMTGGAIATMDPITGEAIQSFSGATHGNNIIRTSFGGADGATFVISASLDSSIRVWRTLTGQDVIVLDGAHGQSAINAAVWAPDGKAIVSGGDDGKIIIWISARDAGVAG
ncbi:PLU-1-domain-containing protein [Piedraia hortae CBS 480.64]|uniref:PLU-1-domain-containing protein n=1 Tax=Piedraia hortae CBS 480.64 TaxID=1314780 RepID=A0A6A7BTJ6_9PEZI|nr:PLU-1-domain-containing protein [Piedraia hortae CBS 480.64]